MLVYQRVAMLEKWYLVVNIQKAIEYWIYVDLASFQMVINHH